MSPPKNGQNRKDIRPGLTVDVFSRKTSDRQEDTRHRQRDPHQFLNHPHGIKVKLPDGQVGRVQEIIE